MIYLLSNLTSCRCFILLLACWMVCLNSLDEIVFAAIANNQINAGEGRDSLRIEFRVATGNDEQRVGMSAVRLVYKLARTTVAKMRHSAGVDDVDIGHLIEVA